MRILARGTMHLWFTMSYRFRASHHMVNTRHAKEHFFDLIRRVEKGEEFTITRAGVPIARLLPIEAKSIRPLGTERGKVWIADDFDAPLPDYLLRQFYGGELPELEKSPKIRRKKREKGR